MSFRVNFGTFDSFPAGPDINQVYDACCPNKMANNQFKPVQESRHKVLRAYCSNIYCAEQGCTSG